MINRTVHASGLLGREIRDIGRQTVQRRETALVRFERHRVTESGEENLPIAPAEIFRTQIPVRHAALVHAGHGAGHLFREAEKTDQIHRHLVGQRRRLPVPVKARHPVEKLRHARAALDIFHGAHGFDTLARILRPPQFFCGGSFFRW